MWKIIFVFTFIGFLLGSFSPLLADYKETLTSGEIKEALDDKPVTMTEPIDEKVELIKAKLDPKKVPSYFSSYRVINSSNSSLYRCSRCEI